jgi:hypothetical protein
MLCAGSSFTFLYRYKHVCTWYRHGTDMSVPFCQILSRWSGFQMIHLNTSPLAVPQLIHPGAITLHLESCTPGQDWPKWYILVRSSTYVPVRTSTTRYKAVREFHSRTYRYVLVHTSTYFQQDKLFSDSPRKSQER